MNLVHLRSFLAVIETGSFRAAAARLGISQPAVSQHVGKLEESLGVRLVERQAAGCVATTRATEFARHARTLLQIAERARASLGGSELRVGASSNVGTYLLPPVFADFLERNGVAGKLLIDSNLVVAEKLRNGEIDVAAVEWWEDGIYRKHQFRSEAWRNEPIVLIVGRSHRWAEQKSVTPAALVDEKILGGEAGTGTGRVLREGLGELAGELRISQSLGSTEAVKEGVKAGLGVSLVLRSAVREELATGSLHEVKLRGVSLCKTIRLVTPEGLPESSLPRRFFTETINGAA